MTFVSHPQTEREATRDAQIFLNLLDPTHQVRVDGVAGVQTRAAFEKLSVEGKGLVTMMLKQRNGQAANAIVDPPQPVEKGLWLKKPEIVRLINRAQSDFGDMPVEGGGVAFMTWLLDLEPARRQRDGVVEYRADMINKYGYYGLFQMGRLAFVDVVNSGKIPGLPPLAVAGLDPWLNTATAWVYAQLAVGHLRSGNRQLGVPGYRGPITPEVLYGAYNQGAIGFLKGAKNAVEQNGQSGHAKQVILVGLATAKKYS